MWGAYRLQVLMGLSRIDTFGVIILLKGALLVEIQDATPSKDSKIVSTWAAAWNLPFHGAQEGQTTERAICRFHFLLYSYPSRDLLFHL